MAQPFDVQNLTLRGGPRAIADHIETRPWPVAPTRSPASLPLPTACWCSAPASNSPSLHCSGSIAPGGNSASLASPQTTRTPLSPDDTKLAIGIRDPQTKMRDIWVFDLWRGTRTRPTFDPVDDLDSI